MKTIVARKTALDLERRNTFPKPMSVQSRKSHVRNAARFAYDV